MKIPSPVYVAGHKGLIGSAFLRRLRRESSVDVLTADHSELELTDASAVREFFERHRPQTVILAAGRVGGIIANRDSPADFITDNLSIQLNVLRSAHRVGVQKLILLGSSCMYPRECPQPMHEGQLLTGHPEPTSLPYAIAKLGGVYMCMAYNQQFGGRRFIPVIPNNAYGPNDNFDPDTSHVLSALIRKFFDAKMRGDKVVSLWGTGSPRREFIHVDDIADACLFLLENDDPDLEVPVNIGSGKDISISELAQLIAEIVEYEGRVEWDDSKPDGAPRKLLDSSRIKSLGWNPAVPFREGVRSTYEWFRNNSHQE
ncbi:MAG: GDP-L-fucose synthase [Candidatus Nitrohelix vancouverensis]|uniref:GDP-L-fucose synthase n=1 Tax=Candidatus Nitrohelix vancouverensis TaxID=2705534 RepID=A0A7T0G3F1_9BACT|nr:MAG: GDP-L-fucose synthase [Candidatus Nitrohelix vancouverensis]